MPTVTWKISDQQRKALALKQQQHQCKSLSAFLNRACFEEEVTPSKLSHIHWALCDLSGRLDTMQMALEQRGLYAQDELHDMRRMLERITILAMDAFNEGQQ